MVPISIKQQSNIHKKYIYIIYVHFVYSIIKKRTKNDKSSQQQTRPLTKKAMSYITVLWWWGGTSSTGCKKNVLSIK